MFTPALPIAPPKRASWPGSSVSTTVTSVGMNSAILCPRSARGPGRRRAARTRPGGQDGGTGARNATGSASARDLRLAPFSPDGVVHQLPEVFRDRPDRDPGPREPPARARILVAHRQREVRREHFEPAQDLAPFTRAHGE